MNLSGDVSECSDAFPENPGVFVHALQLSGQSPLFQIVQIREDRVSVDECAEFVALVIQFGFLIYYSLLMRLHMFVWCSDAPRTANKTVMGTARKSIVEAEL